MPTFKGTTNCDLRIPYKNLPPSSYPTFLPKLFANFVAIERWATYFSRNCSSSGIHHHGAHLLMANLKS